MLIIFAGLPGTGKSTIAHHLSRRIAAAYVRVDTIEQALRSSEQLASKVGAAGYLVAYEVAADNLRLGQTVVVDSINPLNITRDAWMSVAERAQVPAIEIEIVCSDADQHRSRVEARSPDIAGLKLPAWTDVLAREYEAWTRPHLVVDTGVRSGAEAVEDILSALEESSRHSFKKG